MSFEYLLSRVDMSDFVDDSIQDEKVMHERRIVRGAWMMAENDVLHAALSPHRPLRELYALSYKSILLDVLHVIKEFQAEGVSEAEIELYVKYYGKELDNLIEQFEQEQMSSKEAFERLEYLHYERDRKEE